MRASTSNRNTFAAAAALVLAAAGLGGGSVRAQGGYAIDWYSADGGGGSSSGGSYALSGAKGQPDAAVSSGGIYSVAGGFWAASPRARGDCNGDTLADAGDISAMVLEIFDADGGHPSDAYQGTFRGDPVGCNPNGDAAIDAGDVTCGVLRLFNGPNACGP